MTTHTTETVETVETETYRELREGSVPVYGITVPGVTLQLDVAVYARELPDGTVDYDITVVYDEEALTDLTEACMAHPEAHATVEAAIRDAFRETRAQER